MFIDDSKLQRLKQYGEPELSEALFGHYHTDCDHHTAIELYYRKRYRRLLDRLESTLQAFAELRSEAPFHAIAAVLCDSAAEFESVCELNQQLTNAALERIVSIQESLFVGRFCRTVYRITAP